MGARPRPQYGRGEGCLPAGHLCKCICLNVGSIGQIKLSNGYWAKSRLSGVESRLPSMWANSSSELPTTGNNQCTSGPVMSHPGQLHPLRLARDESGTLEDSVTRWEPQSPWKFKPWGFIEDEPSRGIRARGWGPPAPRCSAAVKSGLINHTHRDTASSRISELKAQPDAPSPSPGICLLLRQPISALCSGLNRLQLILRSGMVVE